MELWQAAVLGIVEGITEYLPVSSTGHLILVQSLLGLDGQETKRSIDAFTIVIQGGAILAVLGLYRARVAQMLRGLVGRDEAGLRLAVNLAIAFAPAAVFGALLDNWIESRLFYPGPVVAALFVGGVYMLLVDRWQRRRQEREGARDGVVSVGDVGVVGRAITEVTPLQALGIGLLQCIAMWPGTSRSMMTITGGLLLGRLRARDAAEFSFLLGLPTLGAATVYKVAKNLGESSADGTRHLFQEVGWGASILGLAVATISAALAVKWLVAFLTRHGLGAFGWYRIALCALMLALVGAGVVRISP